MRIAVITAAVGAGVASRVLASTKRKKKPVVKGAPTAWNRAIQRLCPHLSEPYELPWILNNGHVRSRGLSRSLAVSRGLFVGAPRSLTSDPLTFSRAFRWRRSSLPSSGQTPI